MRGELEQESTRNAVPSIPRRRARAAAGRKRRGRADPDPAEALAKAGTRGSGQLPHPDPLPPGERGFGAMREISPNGGGWWKPRVELLDPRSGKRNAPALARGSSNRCARQCASHRAGHLCAWAPRGRPSCCCEGASPPSRSSVGSIPIAGDRPLPLDRAEGSAKADGGSAWESNPPIPAEPRFKRI